VHVNKSEGKSKGDWKAAGPVIANLDRALSGYSYDVIEVQSDSAAAALVHFVKQESIDVLILSMGRSKSRLASTIQSRTTDYVASHSPCATLVIHPQVRATHALVSSYDSDCVYRA
jgi:nucleotide-binding universal stress UspA family protein